MKLGFHIRKYELSMWGLYDFVFSNFNSYKIHINLLRHYMYENSMKKTSFGFVYICFFFRFNIYVVVSTIKVFLGSLSAFLKI